ncbi:LOW QUALITY PROTEIN: hypothetical protein V1478_001309 [Vespula squamosa]|uniref:Uncharacterized protein n=1 Tax=Vespula squamosa TaxID=30214 RepID=A0ABD2C140_VESSQ
MNDTKRTLENKDGNPFKDYQIGVPQRSWTWRVPSSYVLPAVSDSRSTCERYFATRSSSSSSSSSSYTILERVVSSETTQKNVRGASFRFVFSRREVGEGGGGEGGGASRRKRRASCKTRKDIVEDRVVSDWTNEFRR